MTTQSRRVTVMFATLFVAATVLVDSGATADAATPRRLADHVVLLDVDGFDPSFLSLAPMPNFDRLARRGSLSVANSTFKTYSNSARATMATGTFPEGHGNTAYYYDPETNRAVTQERFLATETIVQALAEEGRNVAAVQWYIVQDYGATYDDPAHLYVQPGGDCQQRVDVAVDILHQRPVDAAGTKVTVPRIPDFLPVLCGDIDALVHEEGTTSSGLPDVMAQLDRQLGRLVQATKDVGIDGRTTFIVTGDHGMSDWTQPLLPEFMDALDSAGFRTVLARQETPDATDEIIIVDGVRTADVTLRGRAATPEGLAAVKAALTTVPHMTLFDAADLDRLHAGDKVGDLVAEADPPWHFSTLQDGALRGSHGSTDEAHVPLLLSGAGILPNAQPTDPGLVDVSPTIADLLGVAAPDQAQGRSLASRGARP